MTNRIVIEDLESWYFGDWAAVKTAYPRVPGTIPAKAQYRNPDDIQGGTWEALERILDLKPGRLFFRRPAQSRVCQAGCPVYEY